MAWLWNIWEYWEIVIENSEVQELHISQQIEESLQNIFWSDFVSWSDEKKSIIISNLLSLINEDITDVNSIGPWITLTWVNISISIDIPKLLIEWDSSAVEEISFDNITARYQESISLFEKSIIELDVLSNAINKALEKNSDEIWEVIDENDIITEWPFQGKTLVEAVLIYRKKILNSTRALRNLGSIDEVKYPEIIEAREKLLDSNEEYLLLILWIGEKREELTHVIPKTQSECVILIESIVSRKNSRELLEWMKDIHTQIDANNWQDGTVEKNYRFFTETLNSSALRKIRKDIFENSDSENYHNPELLLEFAVLVSGRSSWDEESVTFMQDLWWIWEPSPVDNRLWMPNIANEALVYAMDVPKENEDGTIQSMLTKIMQYIEISDPLLEWKSPHNIVQDSLKKMKTSVLVPNENGENVVLGEVDNFDAFIDWLGYKDIVSKSKNGELWESYKNLSLQEMVAISGLLRISQGIENTTTEITPYTLDQPYIPKPGEEIIEEREIWTFTGTKYFYRVKSNKVSYKKFWQITKKSGQDAVQHVWNELDRNFDDSFWKQLDQVFWNSIWETDNQRAKRFGILDDNSLEYKIFTLYNDINGNGDVWEKSDTSKEAWKTAGFMLAMVAGSMILWWWAIRILRIWGIAINSIAGQWAIMWASGSALGYWLDASFWDARGFYTPTEAIVWIGWDFILGAGTWALSWPLAYIMPNGTPSPIIFTTDLSALWLWPEFYRLHRMNQAWHGSDIFSPEVEWRNPLKTKIIELQTSILKPYLTDIEIKQYINSPQNVEDSEYFWYYWYRFFLQEFWYFWFTISDIPLEFDSRFQEAYSIWKILSPWNNLNVWQTEPEFKEIMQNRNGWVEWIKTRILEVTESWIQKQKRRLSEII